MRRNVIAFAVLVLITGLARAQSSALVPFQALCDKGQLVGLVLLVPTPAAPAGRVITFPPGMCAEEKPAPAQPPAADPPPKERPTRAPRTT